MIPHDLPIKHWTERFGEWLQSEGLLTVSPPGSEQQHTGENGGIE